MRTDQEEGPRRIKDGGVWSDFVIFGYFSEAPCIVWGVSIYREVCVCLHVSFSDQ